VSVYPKKINERLCSSLSRKTIDRVDAIGLAASLECGTNIQFFLSIDEQTGTITDIAFRSNGCGFMLAAADAIADHLRLKDLTKLHGLQSDELTNALQRAIDKWPADREHCINTGIDAIRAAFAEYRRSRVEEFTGERPLICTCFGVSEETIEDTIRQNVEPTVEDIGVLTNAGTGCGSCQMLIQELIESFNLT
jgi:NifU-like protein